MTNSDLQNQFIVAATWHGDLVEADALLERHPELAKSSIHIAAILGDALGVEQFLHHDPSSSNALAQAHEGINPLTALSLSKYLRLAKRPIEGFLAAAKALLDAGADPNKGFTTKGAYPEHETPLYGAAGVAHNAALTTLLLDYGADPNDIEVVYHSPETYDNAALRIVVETGKITPINLTLMLIRKHDMHDYEGVKYLLEKGANPNGKWNELSPLHHALLRDNHISIIKLLLDNGAELSITSNGLTALARAAREGRGDVLQMMREMGYNINLAGPDKLIAACALGDSISIKSVVEAEPNLRSALLQNSGSLLSKFSGTGNMEGVRALLDLGVDVNSAFVEGDAYYGTPKYSLAIHVASWRGRSSVVKLLIERGSHVDTPDPNGHTPLLLAVRACVHSYWTYRRTPESVDALLKAGASIKGIPYPTGYDEIDVLIAAYRNQQDA